MNQKQIFRDPEEKKLLKDLDSVSSLEQSSEEQEEKLQKLLNELANLIVESQELLNKISKSK
jgi:hypothetical protein